jgi:hypothetical protein
MYALFLVWEWIDQVKLMHGHFLTCREASYDTIEAFEAYITSIGFGREQKG